MRMLLISAALLSLAAPAVAGERDGRRDDRHREADRAVRQLADPAVTREVGATLGALVDAMMDIRVGRLAAVLDGDRRPSARVAERTIGDLASRDDPYFRERTQAQVRAVTAGSGAAMRALSFAIPELMRTMDQVESDIERVVRTIPMSR